MSAELVIEPAMPVASGVLHSPRVRAGTRVPPSRCGWIPLAARLRWCSKNGMSLCPAPADDGQPASSTWLGRRDVSLAETSVVAFLLERAALPGKHSTRVPSRWAAAVEKITLRVSGQNVYGLRMLTLPQYSSSSSALGVPSRERRLGPGGAYDARKKQM